MMEILLVRQSCPLCHPWAAKHCCEIERLSLCLCNTLQGHLSQLRQMKYLRQIQKSRHFFHQDFAIFGRENEVSSTRTKVGEDTKSCSFESSHAVQIMPKVRFYPGVSDALKFASSRVCIVTTKQSRFADALLRELAGITIPPERIFGLGTGPKVEVLKQLQKKQENRGATLHFVEDRLATLKNVIKEPELESWNLYLGDWGYNTQKEREEAATFSRIRLLELSDFTNKLK